MISSRELHPPATLWLCAALAVALHGAILFAWKFAAAESPADTIEGDSVEVMLVESAPGAAAAVVEPPPVAPPEPVPASMPEPAKKEPEMTLPEPPKPKPAPRSVPAATFLPKPTPRPATARRNPAPQNFTAAGITGGASAPTGTAAVGKSAKATYIVRPTASYPPESRAAGEHGVVILRLVVDGNGRPASVTVGRSSGYPRLDRAAVEAGWRARVRDAAPGSRLDAPVRFNLTDR